MRQHLNDHNTEFNNQHTELLLKKYLSTNNELELTKQSLQNTNQDLQNTNLELQKTKEALKVSNEMIETLDEKLTNCIDEKNEFQEKVKEMKNDNTLQIKKCFTAIEKAMNATFENLKVVESFDALLPLLDEDNYKIKAETEAAEANTVEYSGQQYHFVKLPILSYETRMENVLHSMDVGRVYHVNENECYFKLKIKENGYENHNLHAQFYHDLNLFQRSYAKYIMYYGEEICLLDLDGYQLSFKINGYQDQKCSLYLYHTIAGCNKHLLLLSTWNNVNWVNHKSSSSSEILFHLVKN